MSMRRVSVKLQYFSHLRPLLLLAHFHQIYWSPKHPICLLATHPFHSHNYPITSLPHDLLTRIIATELSLQEARHRSSHALRLETRDSGVSVTDHDATVAVVATAATTTTSSSDRPAEENSGTCIAAIVNGRGALTSDLLPLFSMVETRERID